MKQVPLSKLENLIVKPGFDKYLKPLVMYRGAMTLGQAHRWWNLMVSAMEHDAEPSDITQRLAQDPNYSQLCGPERRVASVSLRSFVGRLLDNPKVMGEMPHLEDYVRGLLPSYKDGFSLIRVDETTYRRRNMGAGGWRKLARAPRTGSNLSRVSLPLVYPFLIHDGGKPEHDLLRKVNAAVAQWFPPHMRADMCQDLIVGILSGDFDVDNLARPASEVRKRVMAFCQNKHTEVSLHDTVPGTDDLIWLDMFSEEDSLWARI